MIDVILRDAFLICVFHFSLIFLIIKSILMKNVMDEDIVVVFLYLKYT